ncbi:MAG: hypothetical protein ACRC4N_17770 [Gammaproteobacteria bacterium]
MLVEESAGMNIISLSLSLSRILRCVLHAGTLHSSVRFALSDWPVHERYLRSSEMPKTSVCVKHTA